MFNSIASHPRNLGNCSAGKISVPANEIDLEMSHEGTQTGIGLFHIGLLTLSSSVRHSNSSVWGEKREGTCGV